MDPEDICLGVIPLHQQLMPLGYRQRQFCKMLLWISDNPPAMSENSPPSNRGGIKQIGVVFPRTSQAGLSLTIDSVKSNFAPKLSGSKGLWSQGSSSLPSGHSVRRTSPGTAGYGSGFALQGFHQFLKVHPGGQASKATCRNRLAAVGKWGSRQREYTAPGY